MRLVELEPKFIRREIQHCDHGLSDACSFVHTEPQEHEVWAPVEAIEEADGILFLCPKCWKGGPVGAHPVICWRLRVPPEVQPNPGRWEFEGKGFEDLSLVAGSSSVRLEGGLQRALPRREG